MKKYSYLLFFNLLAFIATAQPTLTSPSDGAIGLIAPVTFQWIADPNANNYDFQIATNPTFTNNLSTFTVNFQQYIKSSGLSPGVTYYWRMRSNYGSSYSAYTFSNSFTMQSAPVASFSGSPTSICAGSDVSFSSSSSGITSYSWSFPGGTPSSSTSSSPTVTYNSAGVYSVTLTVSNSLGNNTLTKTNYINVGTNFGTSVSVTKGSLLKCPVDTVELTASPSPSGTGYTYSWSNSATTQSIKTTQFGTFSVSISKGGCTKSISRVIVRDTLPIFINTIGGTGICMGDSTQLIAVDSGYTGFLWSTNATGSQITVKQPNLYILTATDSKSCPRKGSVTITWAYPNKKINVQGYYSNVLCIDDSIVLNAPSGFTSYVWSNGKTQQQIAVDSPGTYLLSVIYTDSIGCKAKDSIALNFTKTKCYEGVYTVGGNAPDFLSPKAAMDSLNKYGISGKVTFKIRDGLYYGRLVLNEVKGATAIRDVTFESETGYPQNVILTADDSVLFLNASASYLTFKNITFKDTLHERLVVSKRNANLDSHKHLNFIGNIFTGSGNMQYYLANQANSVLTWPIYVYDIDTFSFALNTFRNVFRGLSVTYANVGLISGNKFFTGKESLYILVGSEIRISNNEIVTNDNGFNFAQTYGIDIGGSKGMIISENKVTVYCSGVGSVFVYPFALKYRRISQEHARVIIINNDLSVLSKRYNQSFGLEISGRNFFVAHNNIRGNPAFFYRHNYGDSNNVINNNFSLSTDSGHFIMFHKNLDTGLPHSSSLSVYKNNNYSFKDSTKAYFVDYVNMQNQIYITYKPYSVWKAAQAFDKDSRFVDPKYVSQSNLTPTNPVLNNTVDLLPEVLTDITGTLRPTFKTDIGSHEINTFKDIAIDSVLLSSGSCPAPSSATVRLRNNSLFHKVYKDDSAVVYFKVNNGAAQNIKFSFKKDSLNFYDTALVIVPSLSLNQGIINDIKFWVSYLGDSAAWNDTIQHVFNMALPQVSFSTTGLCIGDTIKFFSSAPTAVSYSWKFADSTSATTLNASKVFNTSSNNVILKVTDSRGCSKEISKTFNLLGLPLVDYTNSLACVNLAVNFISQAPSAITYKWTFPDGSSATTINASKTLNLGVNAVGLRVVDSFGCANSILKQIVVNNLPSNTITRTGDSISAVAGMSYKWYLNNTLLPNDTLQKVKIKQSGNYKVSVTSPQGCSNSSTNMFYAVTGIKGFDNTDQVMVYPVPATNQLFIELLRANTGSYILTDVTGKEIVQGTLKQGLNSVEVESMKTGIYFITVQTAAGDQLIRKIIKE